MEGNYKYIREYKVGNNGNIANVVRLHPAETSKNSDICDFLKVSDIGKVSYSMENL